MAENTKIEWCDHTANLWWGCTDVHAGCDHCYARTFAKAKGKGDGWDGVRYATVGIWKELPKWQAAAKAAGVQRRVFCGSMMDIFEKSQPVCDWKGNPIPGIETGHFRDRYLHEVIPATPDLMHLLLTKRPSNILKTVPVEWLEPGGWPRNVMTGTSPVDQPTADTLIPQLLRVPGMHFLSMEPLLGPVDIRQYHGTVNNRRSLDWVIAGGESGHGARPMHPEWVADLRNQCAAAGVPFMFKQWGEWMPEMAMSHTMRMEDDGRWDTVLVRLDGSTHTTGPDDHSPYSASDIRMVRVGKKAAGRQLDGRTHDGFPSTQP